MLEEPENEKCPLCNNQGMTFYKNKKQHFYNCNNCFGIFLSHDLRPTKSAEKARYEQHNNDVEDKGYQIFVQPIIKEVINKQATHHLGLDYGAGTGPVISTILIGKGYNIKQYDPFFHPHSELLTKKYDYIICCEVIEHFYEPYNEFEKLKKLLKPEGKLYCMTDIYNNEIDFAKWYYKNDPTHVFIYRAEALWWIKENLYFTNIEIENRLIVFTN